MLTKELGKIESIELCADDSQFGLRVGLTGPWGKVTWTMTAHAGDWDERCKWSEDSRQDMFIAIMFRVHDDLKRAKVSSLSQLRGVPVECIFDSKLIVDWRILEEVL